MHSHVRFKIADTVINYIQRCKTSLPSIVVLPQLITLKI